ncbi:MAG: co-chaperone GroES [Planctomycetota bacterium]
MTESNSDRRLAKAMRYDVIEPVGWRVVIRKDENKRETKSGIVLPDSHAIPVITGRVIAISKEIASDEDRAIKQYDKVLFDPREAVPVELEHDNQMYVVDIDKVLAIFRKHTDVANAEQAGHAADDAGDDVEGADDE